MADTEYLVREVAALRIALGEVATRDFLRSELRDLLEELEGGRATGPRSGRRAARARPGQTRAEPSASPEPVRSRHASRTAPSLPTLEQVTAALATVEDPEIHKPITELDMVKARRDPATTALVAVSVWLTVAGCPMREEITTQGHVPRSAR